MDLSKLEKELEDFLRDGSIEEKRRIKFKDWFSDIDRKSLDKEKTSVEKQTLLRILKIASIDEKCGRISEIISHIFYSENLSLEEKVELLIYFSGHLHLGMRITQKNLKDLALNLIKDMVSAEKRLENIESKLEFISPDNKKQNLQ